ncbi:MAG TPA: VOC family protein [Pseudonocardia sp.]|nr:VOC family protein [Pseudonocardia sp.]
MTVAFNHTIVATRDQDAGAAFLAEVLGLPAPTRFGPFTVVELAHGASLDYMNSAEVRPQHYAFLVSEDEFDAVTGRLRERGVPTYADPGHRRRGHNTNDGGRGAYFDSPEGHNLEVLTRPYGSGPA